MFASVCKKHHTPYPWEKVIGYCNYIMGAFPEILVLRNMIGRKTEAGAEVKFYGQENWLS